MNKLMIMSYKEQINDLRKLIEQVSKKNGGDEQEWLNEYIAEVINMNKSDLDGAFKCFRSLF